MFPVLSFLHSSLLRFFIAQKFKGFCDWTILLTETHRLTAAKSRKRKKRNG